MKPGYIDPTGEAGKGVIALKPPFMFRDVTARVFPLKANMGRLTQFIDQYLNMDIPDEIVHFTPALPYVYFTVLNYGGMSPTSRAAQHAGWIAQHEVTFTIPLQRWKRIDGKLVFQDWASVSPFIYVDDAMSQTTGREVYGWPKVLARIDADTPFWASHPRAGTRLFSLSTDMFADVYAGQAETARVLLEVVRDPVASYAEFPPNLKCPWSVTSVVPNVISNSLALMGDALDIAAGLRLRGFPPGRNVGALLDMGIKGAGMAWNMLAGLPLPGLAPRANAAQDNRDIDASGLRARDALPRLFNNTVNLKQYRDPEDPTLACYTAVVNSRMGVDRVNQYGLLGDWDLLRGDPTGGYKVRIHRYASQPIIEALGLEVAGTEEDADRRAVAVLKPSFPFWVDVDMLYGTGQVICARTPRLAADNANTLWIDGATGVAPDMKQQGQAAIADLMAPNAFNTALGAATQSVSGPFHFPDVMLQVYPLLADPARLQAFVDRCWNDPFAVSGDGLRFAPAGSYVYMIVSVNGDKRGTMWSASNNLGWWAEREVSFCVPVGLYRGEELVTLALVEPYVYADHGRAVITDREVNGRNSVVAQIDSPTDVWTTPDGPAGDRHLLHVATEIFPAFYTEQHAGHRTLIKVDQKDVLPEGDKTGWQGIADTWGRHAVEDLKRKSRLAQDQANNVIAVQALALEILAHKAPVNRLTMKQYRDAADLDKACYQAAVLTERALTRVYDIREIEQRVHVRINRVPGHPIVEALGLRVKSVDSVGGAVTDNLQPIRPFWMHVGIREELGKTVAIAEIPQGQAAVTPGAERHARPAWHMRHPIFEAPKAPATPREGDGYFASGGHICGGLSLVESLADGHAQELRDEAVAWLRQSLTNQVALAVHSAQTSGRTDRIRQALAAVPGSDGAARIAGDLLGTPPEAFRPFCDALPIETLEAVADRLDAAHPVLADETLPLAGAKTVYGDMSTANEDLPFEPWWYSPEWAAYALTVPAKQVRPEDRAAYAQVLRQDKPAFAGGDSNPIGDAAAIARWIMETPVPDGRSWTDLIPTTAKFAVWNLLVACRTIDRKWDGATRDKRLSLLSMALPVTVRDAIRHLSEHRKEMAADGGPTLFFALQNAQEEASAISSVVQVPVDANPAALLKTMADGLLAAVYDWTYPERWQRMTRRAAGGAVTAVGDLQIVIESILSDEWASRASVLRSIQPYEIGPDKTLRWPKRPAHSIPVRSFGSIGLPRRGWGERAGLTRWPAAKPDARDTWEFVATGYGDQNDRTPDEDAGDGKRPRPKRKD